jgi:hypothetical protein
MVGRRFDPCRAYHSVSRKSIRPHLSLPDTGVVDEDIDPAEPLLHLSSQFCGVEIGQVYDEPLELRSGGDFAP